MDLNMVVFDAKSSQRVVLFASVLCFGISAKLQFTSCHYWENKLREKTAGFLYAPLQILLTTHLNFGRFDTEEEAVAIANATDVGLAGRRPSWLSGAPIISQADAGVCLLDAILGFRKDTSLEHMFAAF